MDIKVLRDSKARPYLAVVNGRLQKVRPKERYWALAEQIDSLHAGSTSQANALAAATPLTGETVSDDEPPDSCWPPLSESDHPGSRVMVRRRAA